MIRFGAGVAVGACAGALAVTVARRDRDAALWKAGAAVGRQEVTHRIEGWAEREPEMPVADAVQLLALAAASRDGAR